ASHQRHQSRRDDCRGAEDPDGGRRHPAGVRQGARRRVAAFEGAGRMTMAGDSALDAFLVLIADRGYEAVTLRDVAEQAGLSLSDLYRAYPDKMALGAAFLARRDRDVLGGTPAGSDREETARERLFDAMMRRYDSLKQYRAAWRAIRRATTRDPILALRLADPLRRSLAATLEAASIPSDGFSGALRQNGLLAIHFA